MPCKCYRGKGQACLKSDKTTAWKNSADAKVVNDSISLDSGAPEAMDGVVVGDKR